MSVLRRAALGLLLALALAPSALADGDPASDVLVPPDIRVYMTNGATDLELEKTVQATAQKVSDAGLPIKVAIIGNKTDLGAVPQLWAKPQVYARFLGAELRFVYKDTLLIVMPQGFGINGPYPPAEGAGGALRHRPAQGHDPGGPDRLGRQGAARAGGRRRQEDQRRRAAAAADLPLPLIAAAVMVVAGVGGRRAHPARQRQAARAEREQASVDGRADRRGVSASPGAGRSLQSTSTAGSPRTRAPCSPSRGS